MRGGLIAAMVFGATSPKISTTHVSMNVPARTAPSPPTRCATMVASAAAAMLTAVVAEQDEADQTDRAAAASRSATRAAAVPGAREMPQPVTVEAHERRLAAGEERGQHEQHDDQNAINRASGDFVGQRL